MTGGSAIINTNSWAVELNGQHELYESNLETKYILFKFRKIDFTEKILPKEFFRESKLTKFITIPVQEYTIFCIVCIKYFLRVQVGRLWLPSSYNPGLHVRNRYGSSVYKHVEHWLSLGKRNGWLEYGSSSHFTPCPRPDHHACLDHFETDGNIQFQP